MTCNTGTGICLFFFLNKIRNEKWEKQNLQQYNQFKKINEEAQIIFVTLKKIVLPNIAI